MSNTNNNMQPQTSSVLHNDTVSSCLTSKVQEKTQLSRRGCMNSLREIKSQIKFLTETLQDFGTIPIFKRTFSQYLDLLEQHLTKNILSQTDCNTTLTKLRTTFENNFNSEFKERIHKYTRFDDQSFKDAMICNMDFIVRYMLEIILHQQQSQQLLKQKKFLQTQEDQSNTVQALNVDALKVDLVVIQNTCSRKENNISETACSKSVKESSSDFETKDVHAIKYKMSKAKERCMTYFCSLQSHLQVLSKEDLKGTRIEHGFKWAFMSIFGQDDATFISTMFLNVDQLQKQLDKDEFQEDGSMAAFGQLTNKYFAKYTGIEVKQFKDTLLQHIGNVKKSVTERTHHQRQYDRRVNKRQMRTHESKVNTGKELDVYLVDTESIRTDSTVQDESSKSENDTDAYDTNIRPIYDEEPMAEEKVFAIAALKNELRKSKGNDVDTKFAKTSVLGKPILQSLRNQLVVRQSNAFKSERHQISKPRFASQVDVEKDLSKPVTQHYLPRGKEYAFAKPNHMIVSSSSRNSFKNIPRFSSNDIVHNHYLDEARKKI
ncbi:hypothetical protein Tco_0831637 [Tanacetum coccineum]